MTFKLPTRKLLMKIGIPAVLISGMIFAAQLGWNWQKAIRPNIPYTQNQQVFPTTAIVTSVTDGDTLILQNGIRVRLLGINCPERGKPYYEEAKNFTLSRSLGKKVRLEYELGYQNDKFGRILAYVFVLSDPKFPNPPKSPNVSSLNEELLKQGLAQTAFYQDRRKLKYQDQFLQAEAAAKSAHLNLWQ